MKNIAKLAGRLLFWLVWPVSYVELKRTQRTRVLLTCSSRILVSKGWLATDTWGLPGGGLHKNEAITDGALREVFEEVGVALKPEQLIALGEFRFKFRKLPFYCHLFAVKLSKEPVLKLQRSEVSEAQWLSPAELTVTNSSPEVLEAVRRLVAKG